MAKLYGKKIPQFCEIVEQLGPCTARQIFELAPPGSVIQDVETYCTRAVVKGLLKVDRSGKLKKWTVVEGWRAIAEGMTTHTTHHLQAVWR